MGINGLSSLKNYKAGQTMQLKIIFIRPLEKVLGESVN